MFSPQVTGPWYAGPDNGFVGQHRQCQQQQYQQQQQLQLQQQQQQQQHHHHHNNNNQQPQQLPSPVPSPQQRFYDASSSFLPEVLSSHLLARELHSNRPTFSSYSVNTFSQQHSPIAAPSLPSSIPPSLPSSYNMTPSMPSQSPTMSPNSPSSASPQHLAPEQTLQHDLAAQEAAAREWQPQLEGPLVGAMESSQAIPEEYRKADEIYVTKTAALVHQYSHYRKIRGDGNCGWRAIGFGYFEALIQRGDPALIETESVRLTSFNHWLAKVGGFDMGLLIDMTAETIALLQRLTDKVSAGDIPGALHHLEHTFNDEVLSSSIIYHWRMLASTHLENNAARYEDFLGGDVTSFRRNILELVNREIDHIGIKLLHELLLEPLEIVLEIAYLDLTPNTTANVYRWPETAASSDPAPRGQSICLLFRPDHYDILYKGRIEVQVNKANISYHSDNKFESTHGPLSSFATLDFSQLAMIPGFTKFPPPSSVSGKDPMSVDHGFMPMESNVWDSNSGLGMVSSQKPSPMATANRIPEIQTPFSQITAANTQLPLQLHGTHSRQSLTPVSETPSPIIQSSAPEMQLPPRSSLMSSSSIKQQYPLRFSMQYFQLNDSFQQSQPIMRSKNSHLNKAHFKNPRFTPEQWTPRDYEEL